MLLDRLHALERSLSDGRKHQAGGHVQGWRGDVKESEVQGKMGDNMLYMWWSPFTTSNMSASRRGPLRRGLMNMRAVYGERAAVQQ